mmetsp:Transcript_163675/g.397778  ORF Transcript_163675/g.397778 Transcript_163675/m.397778 type:complete len:283 (+) Transcript_163675:777-1625(+)
MQRGRGHHRRHGAPDFGSFAGGSVRRPLCPRDGGHQGHGQGSGPLRCLLLLPVGRADRVQGARHPHGPLPDCDGRPALPRRPRQQLRDPCHRGHDRAAPRQQLPSPGPRHGERRLPDEARLRRLCELPGRAGQGRCLAPGRCASAGASGRRAQDAGDGGSGRPRRGRELRGAPQPEGGGLAQHRGRSAHRRPRRWQTLRGPIHAGRRGRSQGVHGRRCGCGHEDRRERRQGRQGCVPDAAAGQALKKLTRHSSMRQGPLCWLPPLRGVLDMDQQSVVYCGGT